MHRLWLSLLVPYWLFGCALCSLYTPSATVDITLFEEQQTLKSLHMVWNFSDDFIRELKSRYDTNKNNVLDPKALERIHTILDAYVSKREFLTLLEYAPKEGAVQKVPLRSFAKPFHFQEGTLSFTFIFSLNQPIHDEDELFVTLEDKQGYFKFIAHSFTNKLSSFPKTQSNAYNHILFVKVASNEVQDVRPPTMEVSQKRLPKTPPVQKSWLEERLSLLQDTDQRGI